MDAAHFFESLTLRKALSISLVAHGVAITFILIHPHLFRSTRTFRPTVYRVNLVSLPPSPAPAAKTAPAASASAPAKKAPSGPRVIENTRKVVSRKKSAPQTPAKPQPPPPKDRSAELSQAIASLKQNLVEKIEQESSLHPGPIILGDATAPGRSDPIFQRYLEELTEKIKSSWTYPPSRPPPNANNPINISKG